MKIEGFLKNSFHISPEACRYEDGKSRAEKKEKFLKTIPIFSLRVVDRKMRSDKEVIKRNDKFRCEA